MISPATRSFAPPAVPIPVSAAVPVDPERSARRGAAVGDVVLDAGSFWGRRQQVNGEATLAHCLEWMERLGWLENFDRVARGEFTHERAGWQFSDSEIYKLLEAMSWELGRRRETPEEDAQLTATFEALVERVAAAQDDDGYLGTAFGHPGLPDRYSDLAMGHELYNMGHLLQAAVARVRTHGHDTLVAVARLAADHICDEFGEGRREGICGHPEIEVALAEFGRALGEDRYIDQARLFVERRGHGTLPVRPLLSAEYFQDDVPVREAEALRGHAVRALYLSAGAADIAVHDDDDELLDALRRQWDRTIERRTYVTGGMGSRHQDEGFGDDWELPADRAYCETCAGVGSVMFSWRMYLATGDIRYVDLIERTLFNVVATSPREDGRAFFYANPLHQREAGSEPTAGVNTRAEGGSRAPWFEVSCCPTNVARTLASLPAYVAAVEGDTVVLLQYAAGRISLGGFVLDIQSSYPDDGIVRITVVGAPDDEAGVRLRIPAWAADAIVSDPGSPSRAVQAGWADIRRQFTQGDEIVLDLRIRPRFTYSDRRVDAVRGTVAVERGPLVLCLESTDLDEGVPLEAVFVDTSVEPVASGDGATVGAMIADVDGPITGTLPYGTFRPSPSIAAVRDVALVPYHRWAERGPSSMRVFIPTADGLDTMADADTR